MIVHTTLGNLCNYQVGEREMDMLQIEWYETGKRIFHKKTLKGREVIFKSLNQSSALQPGDVLFEDVDVVIVIDILPCECIVVKPQSFYQVAAICYEIGNKHVPLFYEEDELLTAYEAPLFRQLDAAGFAPQKQMRRLVNALKTSVRPHTVGTTNSSLFSRILQLTTPSNE